MSTVSSSGVGGYRENAGRKAAFDYKSQDSVSMVFTPLGDAMYVAACESTGLSRNDVMTHLVLKHAKDLAFDVDGIVYKGKDYKGVRSIRLTKEARAELDAAKKRTGKSYSDLAEALLMRFAAKTRDFPKPYDKVKAAKKRKREARRLNKAN